MMIIEAAIPQAFKHPHRLRVQIDLDGDGQISLTEFKGLVTSLEKQRGGLRPRGYDPGRAAFVKPKLDKSRSAGAANASDSTPGL